MTLDEWGWIENERAVDRTSDYWSSYRHAMRRDHASKIGRLCERCEAREDA